MSKASASRRRSRPSAPPLPHRGASSPRQKRAEEAAARRRSRRRKHQVIGAAAVLIAVGTVVALLVASGGSRSTGPGGPTVGRVAPNGTFTTLSGDRSEVASLTGKPTLLWLVTTWCSSCQAGTQAIAQNIATLATYGVRIVELEVAGDLGQSGPTMAQFAQQFAGPKFIDNADWTFGSASSSLTKTYDPNGDLDIYYLLDSHRKVVYVSSSPAATMPELMRMIQSL